MPETPVTFEAAQAWLAGRVNVPTSLNSAELALSPGFPTAAKAQAFFSARVSSANILDALREQVTEIAEGRINVATARMRLKTFLAGQGIPADDVGMTAGPPPGVSEEDWIARRKITNLASTRRINLIMRQNVGQAHAIGRREVSMHPAVEDRWPYFRYIAVQDGRARDEHGRLNNLVLPKSDPFWHTHTPPWDYNCRCDIEDADQAEADQIGIARTSGTTITNPGTGETFQDLPNESGYSWDITSSMGDPSALAWDAIKDATLRGIIRSELDEIADSRTPPDETGPRPPDTTDLRGLPIDQALAHDGAAFEREIREVTAAGQEYSRVSTDLAIEEAELARKRKDAFDALSNRPRTSEGFRQRDRLEAEYNAAKAEQVAFSTRSKDALAAARRRQTAALAAKQDAGLVPQFQSKVFTGKRKADVIEGLSRVSEITDLDAVRGNKVAVRAYRGKRSNANGDALNLAKSANVKTVAHEAGHWIEDRDPHVHERCIEFLDYRCAGEKPRRLKDIYPGSNYKADEVAREDKWFNAYCGKDYHWQGKRYATEVLSMGAQRMAIDPAAFAAEDPEYFRFTLGVLRGTI